VSAVSPSDASPTVRTVRRPLLRRAAALDELVRAALVLLVALLLGADESSRPPADGGDVPAHPAAPVASDARPRLALLVGVSQYPQTRRRVQDQSGSWRETVPWRPLHAHRDLTEMQRILVSPKFGFRADDILTLEDGRATKDAIRQAFLGYLYERARPGAIIVIHLSLHGQQIADDSGDELDGLDESLVPAESDDQDARVGSHVNIRDDEVEQWLSAIATRMHSANVRLECSLNIFIDSCFSGTATRGLLAERGRAWDEKLDGPRPAPRWSVKAQPTAAAFLKHPNEYNVISAAQSNQTAKERNQMGVFSRALVDALERSNHRTTYQALLDDVSSTIAESVRNQTPQLEGQGDQVLFSGRLGSVPPYIPIQAAAGDGATLPAGSLHLLTVGSIYHLFPSSAEPDAAPSTEARIVSTTPLESSLQITRWNGEPSPQALRGGRAVEVAHFYGDQRLSASFQKLPAGLSQRIRELPFVQVASEDEGVCDLKLQRCGGRVVISRPETGEPVWVGPLDGAVAQTLERIIRAEWRWRQLLSLRQENSGLTVSLRLVPVQLTWTQDHTLVQPPLERRDVRSASGEALQLTEGDFFMLELQNRSSAGAWVTVLELGPDSSIKVVFPTAASQGDNWIPAGQRIMVPWSVALFEVEPPLGQSIFKVIATRQKVDFGKLVQSALALPPGGPQRSANLKRLAALANAAGADWNPLGVLLAEVTSGQRIGVRAAVSIGSWGVTATRLIQLPRHAAAAAALPQCEP